MGKNLVSSDELQSPEKHLKCPSLDWGWASTPWGCWSRTSLQCRGWGWTLSRGAPGLNCRHSVQQQGQDITPTYKPCEILS